MNTTQKKYQYLFVYGTLKRDFHHEALTHIMQDIEFAGESTVSGIMYDIGEYPGAVPNTSTKIKGEVFKLLRPRRVIQFLDEYEGYDSAHLKQSEYLRRKEIIQLKEENVEAWIYWYNYPVDDKKVIRHQNYLDYVKSAKHKEKPKPAKLNKVNQQA